MSTSTTNHKLAYIFRDICGWSICDDDGPLDTRGKLYDSKRAALASLKQQYKDGHTDYTHYCVSGGRPYKL